MKKLIILSFVALAVIIFSMNLSSSTRISYLMNSNIPNYVDYQVNIHPNWTITHNSCPTLVRLLDGGSRMPVGLPQIYHQGINTYHFYEIGPVTGVRIAKLTNEVKDSPNDVCYLVSLSDSKTGTFNNGMTYVFNLYASAKDIIATDNSSVSQ